jgi:1-deoxy-D-xylulose-5-phosphate synthase
MGLLESIEEPADLRALPQWALAQIADELRAELIAVGAVAGGHFAASLGTVELTVALHRVFDTPRDRLVWDVGHQTRGHKVLTGRRTALYRIRRAGGPSAFLRRCESEYDAFGGGHAGTSISAALGMVAAAPHHHSGLRAVAIIGDGAMTSGMAFEGLNHAGELQLPLKVVFNDNGMSIAPNVGGLSRNAQSRHYFEALGLEYRGPVDGHDLDALVPALEALRDSNRPTVLHVRTCKGKGFAPAEADPYRWHATTPFDPQSGLPRTPATQILPSWTAAFADALIRLAEEDERIVAITAAMPNGTGLDRFAARFPHRTYDVGIAEQHAVTFAAGLATEGLRPVCAIYSSFLQRAFDQIVHDVALQNLPVVFALGRGGLVGADGPTHHGMLDFAYLRMIPNVTVAAPRDENELQHLLATALSHDGPFALRFPRGAACGVPLDAKPSAIPVGDAEILRKGNHVALLAIGSTVTAALAAADELQAVGLSTMVVDARFVKPLDTAMLAAVARRCGRVVTVEDHALEAGFGSAVLERLNTVAPGTPVLRIGIPDEFVEHGDTAQQWRAAGIDHESIAHHTARWVRLLNEIRGKGRTETRVDASEAYPVSAEH